MGSSAGGGGGAGVAYNTNATQAANGQKANSNTKNTVQNINGQ